MDSSLSQGFCHRGRAVGGEPFATGVWHCSKRFLHGQTFFRDRKIHAPANVFAGQAIIITIRIEAEQRKPEAILAARRTMARSSVATGLHKDGHHVELETDWPLRMSMLDIDWDRQSSVFPSASG